MGAGHQHGGDHGHGAGETRGAAYRGRLWLALGIAGLLLVAQLVGALVTNSLALLADAGHVATDAVGIGMALVAIHFANRPADSERRTFGLARMEILAALVNCLLLLGVGGYILVESISRLREPTEVPGATTVVFGVVGLGLNCLSLALLMRGQRENLNVRGAFLEVLADALGSVAVIVAALVILLTGWQRADPVASLLIALMIVPRTVKLAREALEVLLESAPRDVAVAEVRDHILRLPGVEGVHDLHVWTITSGMPVLSAHVVVNAEALDAVGHERTLHELQNCLGSHFDVAHCTFQLEPSGHAAHEAGLCH